MNISIIGTGRMGRSLTKRFVTAGLDVILGVRNYENNDKLQEISKKQSGDIKISPVAEAIQAGEIVIFATWFTVTQELVVEFQKQLADKIIIDISNPFAPDMKGFLTDFDSSAAEEIVGKAEGLRVVKAFNTNFSGALWEGAVAGRPLDVFVASDDEEARSTILEVVAQLGLRGVDAGPLASARTLERMVLLQAGTMGRMKLSPVTAFGLLTQ